jgi:hypothetical protein
MLKASVSGCRLVQKLFAIDTNEKIHDAPQAFNVRCGEGKYAVEFFTNPSGKAGWELLL